MFDRLENNSSNIKLLPNRRLQNKFNTKSQNISDFSNIFFSNRYHVHVDLRI